jgi:RNA polymerase sigma-70 factor (ECF subfamily)
MSNKPGIENPAAVDEDHEFVSACQRGDVNAFQPLVEKYQKKMLNLAYRMTGDYEEACEIAQEAFLSAYRAITKFRGEARFATWLYGITINHARNRMKQMESRSRYEVASLDDPVETENGRLSHDPPSDEAPIVQQLEKKEIQTRVQQCINSLDAEHREVLILRDIQGFSYEEIRDILKIPDGTVKSRLFRARDAMKHCLQTVISDL